MQSLEHCQNGEGGINNKIQKCSFIQNSKSIFLKILFSFETAMRGGLEWEWEGIKFFAAFLDQYLDT